MKLNNYLHKWFKDNIGLNIKFVEDATWGNEDNTVYYSFTEKTEFDDDFRKLCIKIEPDVAQFDDFILSLFHEVGHILSIGYIDEETWDSYEDMNDYLEQQDKLTKRLYKKYINHPVEFLATEAGMELIHQNLKAVKELQNNIN